MLTRLKVDGFKNLDGVDVRFGPFTCIAGPNGAGKSNLFDAILFLGALAQKPLMDAARDVRGGDVRRAGVANLFRKVGERSHESMRFLVEFLIPPEGEDELGQAATASMTFLRYDLRLRYLPDAEFQSMGTLAIEHESLVHINKSSAKENLQFEHKKAWRDSVVQGRRTSPYISTEIEGGEPVVSLHTDSRGGLGGGRPRRIAASTLPRTILSSVNNAVEHRTLVLAQKEMAGWTELQLEPSALRAPDSFGAPRTLASNGAHLPSTLYGLARSAELEEPGGQDNVFAEVANRLSELVENVRNISVDVDEKNQLFSVVMTDRYRTEHVASALSDGTLRFLVLAVMEADPGSRRLLCLEEPENGMHPLRIPAVMRLLGDLAVDVETPVGSDNPLRQVIINTHSPSVVACVDDSALLVAHPVTSVINGLEEPRLALRFLAGTWRHRHMKQAPVVTRGDLLGYLNPFSAFIEEDWGERVGAARKVMDRSDLQIEMPLVVRRQDS